MVAGASCCAVPCSLRVATKEAGEDTDEGRWVASTEEAENVDEVERERAEEAPTGEASVVRGAPARRVGRDRARDRRAAAMMEGGRNGLSEDNETGDSKDCAGRQQYKEGSTKGEGEVGRQGERERRGEDRERWQINTSDITLRTACVMLRNPGSSAIAELP